MKCKDLSWSKGVGFLGEDMELGMTSYLNSNFGRNLNRFPSSFWFQTLQALIEYTLFLSMVERCMMV
jgi:hypothetical protein